MKLTPIISEKDIKTLLLEEFESLKEEKTRKLIILSPKRFDEFIKRMDVREDSYDYGDYVIKNNVINYRVYENERVLCCKCYGIITFLPISGLYIVKDLFHFRDYKDDKEASKIIFIE